MSKKLDFLIIGAQKSATTALFRYLQNHKQIAMPAEKEAPLFTSDVTSAQIDAFIIYILIVRIKTLNLVFAEKQPPNTCAIKMFPVEFSAITPI